MRFDAMPMHPDVLDALDAMGFEEATPIQEQAIPTILQGKDFLGIAQTGTGKTAAFLLPTIDRILDTEDNGKTKALIVVPTRELAMQIDQAVEGFGYYAKVTSLAIYGGGSAHDFSREKKALTDGADIIIATPGRFLSHLTLGYVDLSELQCLILDEADRMLDMGFVGDIMRIAEKCRDDRQTLLFSATMPDRIEDLASDLQKDPEVVKLALSKPAEKIKQGAYVLFDHQKDEVLVEVLKDRNVASGIVFTSRKKTVGQVIRVLRKAGIKCERIIRFRAKRTGGGRSAFDSANSRSSWRPMWSAEASTSTTSSWWSITMCRPMKRITCTALAELRVPTAMGRASHWSILMTSNDSAALSG